MDDRYRLTQLPTDTPDDDPRWRALTEAQRLGFVDPIGSDESVVHNRAHARAVPTRLRAVELVERGQAADMPVATFTSFDGRINVGGGRSVVGNLISDVTVRASHRRRGLLREMMTVDLREAKERGCALASLTASEATIYGRFGFGIATRRVRMEADARRWQLRVPPVGSIEYLDADATAAQLQPMLDAVQARYRGAHADMAFLPDYVLGRFDWENDGPNKKMRQIAHLAEDGSVDGLVSYTTSQEDRQTTAFLDGVLAASPAVELALWDAVAHIDLIDKVAGFVPWDSPIPWALTDFRATSVTRRVDTVWLRVLDVVAALEARAWSADGSLVLDVVDPMDLAAGRWRVDVRDGAATLTETTDEPDVWLDVETLGSLYFGDVPVATLAAAGRLQGSETGLATLARLVAVPDVVFTPFGF